MRWYQFQLRKPKGWHRRANSDGSAVPKIKRVKSWKRTPQYKRALYLIWGTWLIGMAAPVIVVNLYLILSQYNLNWVMGISPSTSTMFVVTRTVMIGMGISMLIMYAGMFIFYRVKKSEKRNAIAHRCHLCPRCGYSLQSRTSDDQPCPECGQRISRREAVRLWARFCAR